MNKLKIPTPLNDKGFIKCDTMLIVYKNWCEDIDLIYDEEMKKIG